MQTLHKKIRTVVKKVLDVPYIVGNFPYQFDETINNCIYFAVAANATIDTYTCPKATIAKISNALTEASITNVTVSYELDKALYREEFIVTIK